MTGKIEQVGSFLRNAKRVLFITGAGVSAESGIPTFRGATAAFPDGRTEEGMAFEEVLSRTTFLKQPSLCWKYFFRLETSLRGKRPNPAHFAISEMQSAQRFVCVATQNIDGLHQTAGSSCVLELHGNLRRLICTACSYREYFESFEGLAPLPRCPGCNGILRPDAVLYEEGLPVEVVNRLEEEQYKGFDLVFSVGTTSQFYYVMLPVILASNARVPVVEINPEETPVSGMANFRFHESAGNILQAVLQAAR